MLSDFLQEITLTELLDTRI
uniref:Uncharacterized protein n=1 Tax=Anguilla anguilla TaxID=7936 RepID=A0A0E9SJ11_ANGAN